MNPELHVTDASQTLRPAVERLFGTGNRSVVRAVGAFLQQRRGSFDDANLRLIAAAAPMLDPHQLALLIERLPLTQLRVAIAPIDLDAARAHFSRSLSDVPVTNRARLVASLIEDGTQRTLDLIPEAAFGENGHRMNRQHFERELGKARPAAAVTLLRSYSRYVDSELLQRTYERHPNNWELAMTVAAADAAPAAVLEALSRSEHPEVRNAVARNPSTAAGTLSAMCADSSPLVTESLARRANISSEALAALGQCADSGTRRAVAAHVNSPRETLKHLGELSRWDAASAAPVVLNANTSPIVRRRLLKVSAVQLHLARDSTTPPAILTTIAKTTDDVVQVCLAGNTNTPPEVLVELAGSEHYAVRRNVAGHANTPVPALRFLAQDSTLQPAVAANGNTPADLLHWLADRGEPRVLDALASNRATPPELLWRLADVEHFDEDAYEPFSIVQTRASVAGNHAAPPELLSLLSRYDYVGIRRALAANPSTPPRTLEELDLDDVYVRNSLLTNPSTSAAALDNVACDFASGLRTQIAKHANASEKNLRQILAFGEPTSCRHALVALTQRGVTLLPAEINEALAAIDVEAALRFACDADLPGTVGVPHLALPPLLAASEAPGLPGVVGSNKTPKQWSDLPNNDDVPFPTTAKFASLDSRRVCGLSAQLARTARDLKQWHKVMGNCLDTYVDSARGGQVVIAAFDDSFRRETYAVAWAVEEDGSLSVAELNSRYNDYKLPLGFEEGVDRLTADFNCGLLDRTPRRSSAQPDASLGL